MKVQNYNDIMTIADKVCKALPAEEIKEIARNAYVNSIADTMPLVKAIAQKTHSRYLKAAWLLWKFKIFVPNGLIILARIDGYCLAGKNKHYIDLCIYKDIFGAIRTSNSSFFKPR